MTTSEPCRYQRSGLSSRPGILKVAAVRPWTALSWSPDRAPGQRGVFCAGLEDILWCIVGNLLC